MLTAVCLSWAELPKSSGSLLRKKSAFRKAPEPAKKPSIPTKESVEEPAPAKSSTPSEQHEEPAQPTIQVDDNLSIQFPTAQETAKPFYFEPYTQDFINRNVRFLHVTLLEIEPMLPELSFLVKPYLSRIDFLIAIAHYIHLLEAHPIFQLREKALLPLKDFEQRLHYDLLIEMQREPEKWLSRIREYLLEKDFEDIYTLHDFHEKIINHIPKPNLKEPELYDWFEKQANNYKKEDAHWTYLQYLNRAAEKISNHLTGQFRNLFRLNIRALLNYRSQIYLSQARRLLEGFDLLKSPQTISQNLHMELELAQLHFEPYEKASQYYDQLMELYPQLPGTPDYFSNDPEKAKLFLPFFDQLSLYAQRRFEAGKFACQQAFPIDVEKCSPNWREATRFYQFIAKNSPFRTLSRESVKKLKVISQTSIDEQGFIGKAELLSLIDQMEKPHL
jgi:hypothetical protein